MIRLVIGPVLPLPMVRSSTETTGTISAAVPQMNASDAVHTSKSVNGFSSLLIPSPAASSSTVSRVIPLRLVAVGGASTVSPLTMKKLSTVASATYPFTSSISASSALRSFASIRASTLFR